MLIGQLKSLISEEKKYKKLGKYFPNTIDKKPQVPVNPILYYGQINGHLSKLCTDLTLGKSMPLSTDDVLNDFLKTYAILQITNL